MRTDGQSSSPKEQPMQRKSKVHCRIVMVTGVQNGEAGKFHKVLQTGLYSLNWSKGIGEPLNNLGGGEVSFHCRQQLTDILLHSTWGACP